MEQQRKISATRPSSVPSSEPPRIRDWARLEDQRVRADAMEGCAMTEIN